MQARASPGVRRLAAPARGSACEWSGSAPPVESRVGPGGGGPSRRRCWATPPMLSALRVVRGGGGCRGGDAAEKRPWLLDGHRRKARSTPPAPVPARGRGVHPDALVVRDGGARPKRGHHGSPVPSHLGRTGHTDTRRLSRCLQQSGRTLKTLNVLQLNKPSLRTV